jgi:two-component system, LytTR family, response regulator
MDSKRVLLEHKMSKLKKTKKFILMLLAVLAVAVAQDFLQSKYQSYEFYLSESLVFSLLWVLFVPITFGLRYFFKKYSWLSLNKWRLRIAFVLLAVGIHVLLYSLLVQLISAAFMDHTFGIWQTLIYTVSQDLYKYLFVYSALSLIPMTKIEKEKKNVYPVNSEFLWVTTGRNSEKIRIQEIRYIQSSSPYVELFLQDKNYLYSDTLKSLEKKLASRKFARIHKSTLVNLEMVSHLKSRLNGDYDVILNSGEVLRLSRNYVSEFRKRYDSTA